MSLLPGDIWFEHGEYCICLAVYRKGWSSTLLVPPSSDTALVLYSKSCTTRTQDLKAIERALDKEHKRNECSGEFLRYVSPPAYSWKLTL